MTKTQSKKNYKNYKNYNSLSMILKRTLIDGPYYCLLASFEKRTFYNLFFCVRKQDITFILGFDHSGHCVWQTDTHSLDCHLKLYQ